VKQFNPSNPGPCEGPHSFANHVRVDHSKLLALRSFAIHVQLVAIRTRPPVFHATDAQLASTKIRREATIARCALLAQALGFWVPSPCRTVVARLGPSTSETTAPSIAFRAAKGWTVHWLQESRISSLDSPAAPNLLLGLFGFMWHQICCAQLRNLSLCHTMSISAPRFREFDEATIQPWRRCKTDTET